MSAARISSGLSPDEGPDAAYLQQPQRRIAALRARLLGGRGPGATPAELAAHKHERVAFGGLPVTAARERLALATQVARGQPAGAAQRRAAELLTPQSAEGDPGRPRRWRLAAAVFLAGGLLGWVLGSRRSVTRD